MEGAPMKSTLSSMLLRAVIPVLVVSLLFFVSILQLVDLFENISRYLDLEVDLVDILTVQYLYLPTTVHFALPTALLFSVAFTLGNFYSNNELIAVFGSGVSLQSFVAPVIILGFVASIGTFFFYEEVVIASVAQKNEFQDELLRVRVSESRSDVTALGSGARLVYHAEYYNDANQTLSGAIFVRRSNQGVLNQIVHAPTARWTGSEWEALDARVFERTETDDAFFEEQSVERLVLAEFTLPPTAFRRNTRDVDELRLGEARSYIDERRTAGLPFREELTQYYERFSFSLTPFVVVLIATAVGGRFRKNILLMSLLVSLSVSVVYYVAQLVSGLLAQSGLVSPVVGAWFGVMLFIAIGIAMLRTSRT
jgi:lipopolysaccharide export system permease protein